MTTVERSAVEHDPGIGLRLDRTRFESILAVLILLESSRSLYYWYPDIGLIANGGLTNLGRLVWPCMAAGSFFGVMRQPWLVRRSLDPLVVVIIALLGASFIWSVDLPKTLYNSIIFAAILVCGWFLSIAYSRRELVSLASNVLSIVCAVNVIAVLSGVNHGRGGQTTGFLEHKNILGLLAAVGALLVFARIAAGDRRWWTRFSAAATSIALFLSGARTSQFGVVLVLMLLAFIAVRRRSQIVALMLTAPTAALYAVLLRANGGVAAIFTASGKSSDLTGRTDIWAAVVSLIGERPVTGWGFSAYWRDGDFVDGRPSGFEEFGIRSSHNGYLEAALGAGILTGALVAIALLVFVVRGYRGASVGRQHVASGALFALASFALIVNFSEAFFPSSERSILTIMIVALSAGPLMRERR